MYILDSQKFAKLLIIIAQDLSHSYVASRYLRS